MLFDQPATALTGCERALALALLVSSLELLQVRAAFSERGVWRFDILRREHALLPAVLRGLCALLFPYRAFLVLLGLQLIAAALLLCAGVREVLPWLWFSHVAVCVRFRGAYNGGSDAMLLLVALALSVAQIVAPEALVSRACLLYIAVQVTLSYFIAGITKLKEPEWRDGSALTSFLAASTYPAAKRLNAALGPRLRRVAACGVLAFECLFPLAWLDPRLCGLWLAAGAVFHVLNTFVFGLNRFLFAWLAGYPALLFCSQLLTQH
ncbi:MAG: hypothetical protein RL701_7080 [Pseudomonadota bacterium]